MFRRTAAIIALALGLIFAHPASAGALAVYGNDPSWVLGYAAQVQDPAYPARTVLRLPANGPYDYNWVEAYSRTWSTLLANQQGHWLKLCVTARNNSDYGTVSQLAVTSSAFGRSVNGGDIRIFNLTPTYQTQCIDVYDHVQQSSYWVLVAGVSACDCGGLVYLYKLDIYRP